MKTKPIPIKIHRHTKVRYRYSPHMFVSYSGLGLSEAHDIIYPLVKDITTGLDPQVDTTPDWYEDPLEYKEFKGDWKEWHDYMNEQIYKPKWWKFW